MTFGNTDNLKDLVWLFCDLQPHSKTIVRHGWRQGLPEKKTPIWVFCPLLRTNFPRDRELVENCEKCMHCRGLRPPISGMEFTRKWESEASMIKTDTEPTKRVFSKEEIERAEHLSKIEDEEWLEEEKKLQK